MLRHANVERLVASVLVVVMVGFTIPVSAAELGAKDVLGSVRAFGSVELRGVAISQEGTVFAGDRIRAHGGAYAKVFLTGGQSFELRGNADLTVIDDGAMAQLAMASGTVTFAAADRAPLRVDITPYQLMTETGSGLVSVIDGQTVGVRVQSGSLQVKNTETQESFVLTEGQEKLLGRSNGVIADPISVIASNLPAPLPTNPSVPRPSPAPQAGSLSSAAWAAIVAAVAGGAAAATWAVVGRDKVDKSELDAANASVTTLTSQNSTLTSQISTLEGQITTAASAITSRDAQIVAVAAQSQDLANNLITLQNIARVELSALEAQLAAIQIQLSTEQSKAVIAASSLTVAQQATFTAQAEAIATSTATLEAANVVIQSDMARIRAELDALGFSGLTDSGMIVSPIVVLTAPAGASQAIIDKIAEFNLLSATLGANQVALNDNTTALENLLTDLSHLGVTGLPTIDIDTLADAEVVEFVVVVPPSASPFDSYDIRTGTSIAPNDWPLQYKERDGVSPWLDLSLPLGNNVFSEDSVARRLSFLPRPLMQTTGLITGRMPHYLYLADDVSDRRQERERTHFLLLVGGTAFGVLLLSYPLAYIVGLLPRFVSMACRRLIKNRNPRLSQRSR